jgi:pyruvate formate lyase activating enzyme
MNGVDFDKDILPKLIERKKLINHIVISGGESLYDENIEYYIDTLVSKGFKIGIHTNGYNSYLLNKLISKLSFVGMDIKTSFEKYSEICQSKIDISNITNSLKIIINSSVQYDIRTTLYKKLVSFEDLIFITNILKEIGFKEYNIQKYIPLNDDDDNYSNEEIKLFESELNKIITTKARGLI